MTSEARPSCPRAQQASEWPPQPNPSIDIESRSTLTLNDVAPEARAPGGIRETQEMLDFCARHGIVSDIETIAMKDVNVAYERMLKSDVKYRFVIDMATLPSDATAA
jgi:D-arabinose 1-dehydrogenase-like Zn-dependent alcohol dehydrogenase